MVGATENAVEKSIVQTLETYRDQLRGHRVLLFGSRVKGAERDSSDFDIGVDGTDALDLSVFYDIQSSLDRIRTLHSIDWVDLNRVPSKLRESARKEGRVLYEG